MRVQTLTDRKYQGTPMQIVQQMRKASRSKTRSPRQFMADFAQRCNTLRPGTPIRSNDPVFFLVDASTYGFLKLLPDHEEIKLETGQVMGRFVAQRETVNDVQA